MSGDEAKALAAGCDGYIAKPFSPRQLLAKIREFLPEERSTEPSGSRHSHDPPLILASTIRRKISRSCAAPRGEGYEVDHGRGWRRGACEIRDELPDLILLDIMMPKLDGIGGSSSSRTMPRCDRSRSFSSPRRPTRGCRRGAGCRRRRLSDQAVRAQGAARARALDAAPKAFTTPCKPGPAPRGPGRELAAWNRELKPVRSRSARSSGWRLAERFLPRRSPTSSWRRRRALLESHRREVSSCSAICAALRLSPRPPNPKR